MDLRDELQSTLGSSYTLERELGGGGMSRVFVAQETALERKVVVKVLPPELTAGVNVDRFKREILLAARLQHPHIVPVLAAGETNGLPYYTMPFVEGESLRVRLAKSGALSITEAIGVLRDVAKALAYAHERGVVHRDIKPENVLLSGGSATVTDFGIAKALSASRRDGDDAEMPRNRSVAALTAIGTSLGTPAYMAPEQAAADPSTDHRADIYAFGCMAFELLAGRPPFIARTPQKLLAAQMGEAPDPITSLRPDTPAELANVVMQCLAKDADLRPQNAADVVRVLDTVTSGGGHTAMPSILLGGRNALWRALGVWAAALVVVAVLAKAAILVVGLPDWVFPGALAVMALGLPVILFTGYVQHSARRLLTMTPTYTPGGSSVPQGTMATIAMKASPHMSWRRTAVGGAWALGAFVLLIGTFMVLRALGIGPAGSLLAAGKLDANQPLLVADFAPKGGADSALGGVVAEGVRAALTQSSVVSVVPASMIRDALQRMQLPLDSRIDANLARQIAQREGVKAVVAGDITPLGAGFVVTARLVAAQSGNDLATFQATANNPAELIPTVGKIGKDLRGKIGESLRSVQNSPALEAVTTRSLEALKLYAEASRPFADQDYARAIVLLKQAVTADSTFAMAWRRLGVAYYDVDMPPAVIDTAIRNAYRFRDHLTERERLIATATYFDMGPGRDRGKAILAYQQALALGDYAISGNNLGLSLAGRRQFAASESALVAATRADPSSVTHVLNLASTYVDEGKLAAADSVATAFEKRSGPSYPTAVTHSIVQLNEGHLDSARALAMPWRSVADLNERSQVQSVLAGMSMLTGQLQQSMREYAAGVAIDRQRGAIASPLRDSAQAAFLDAWFRGNGTRAVSTLDAALAANPIRSMPLAVRPYAGLAQVYALAGRPDRARAMMSQMDADIRDTSFARVRRPARDAAMGFIALAEKRPLEAVKLFRAADSLPDGPSSECSRCTLFTVGMAFDRANLSDSAIAQFRKFVDTPDTYFVTRADFNTPYDFGFDIAAAQLPFVYKRLGELYEAKGDAGEAATYYAKFVDLWKSADPDLQPQVANVRQRLAHLRDTEKSSTPARH